MQKYKNLHSSSGIIGYEIGVDYITVQFSDGGIYKYTHEKPGQKAVETMKAYAELGQGLNTYMNKSIRKNYAQKIK